MKRRALKLLIFLLLGAIINVAVAWGCALRASVNESSRDVMSVSGKPAVPSDSGVFFRADSEFLQDYCQYRVQTRGLGLRDMRISRWTYNLAHCDTGDVFAQRNCGWPMLSLQGGCREMDEMEWAIALPREWTAWLRPVKVVPDSFGFRVYNSRTALGNSAAPEILPLWPLWPGFAINTIVYAAIAWTLFLVPRMVKRRRRIRRGRCIGCGYPLGSSAVCSECGTSLFQRDALHGVSAPCHPR